MTSCWRGDAVPALDFIEQSIALYDRPAHRDVAFHYGQDPEVTGHAIAALLLWVLGYPDQAVQRISQAFSLAQDLSHGYSLFYVMRFAATMHGLRRDIEVTLAWAEKADAFGKEKGINVGLGIEGMMSVSGWALAEQGQLDEGIAQMRQGLATIQSTRNNLASLYCMAHLAEAYGNNGQIENGLAVIDEALDLVSATGVRFYEAELNRLKGVLLIQAGDSEATMASDPETYFQRALTAAREQQAKSLELRAAMSLARLWQNQGKQDAAKELLRPVYGWFTEGFDTADLVDAKALLDKLETRRS